MVLVPKVGDEIREDGAVYLVSVIRHGEKFTSARAEQVGNPDHYLVRYYPDH